MDVAWSRGTYLVKIELSFVRLSLLNSVNWSSVLTNLGCNFNYLLCYLKTVRAMYVCLFYAMDSERCVEDSMMVRF